MTDRRFAESRRWLTSLGFAAGLMAAAPALSQPLNYVIPFPRAASPM